MLPLNMTMLKLEMLAVSERYRHDRMEIERNDEKLKQRR